ncbi:MAG: cadherin-like domain-containing protein [Thermomicrobiales bacterium]|nr:cadherin-like domain-containing protein [Thermomicrobiales bacterium]
MNLPRIVRRGLPSLGVVALLAPAVFVGPAADASNRAYFNPSNTTTFTINDATNASPYSTAIDVSGMPGQIEYVTVTLNQLRHENTSDIDIMLKAPDGRAAIVMSDVGGDFAINAVTVTIDDRAALNMPETTILTSGTYKSTNYDGGDDDFFGWPAPNPAGPGLGQFTLSPANGRWELFIKDDKAKNVGQLVGGWTLGIKTTNTGPTANTDRYKVKQDTKLRTTRTNGVLANDSDVDKASFWVSGVGTKPAHGKLRLRRDGGFDYTPDKKFVGKDGFTYIVEDGNGKTATGSVAIKVQKDKKAGKGKHKNHKGGNHRR